MAHSAPSPWLNLTLSERRCSHFRRSCSRFLQLGLALHVVWSVLLSRDSETFVPSLWRALPQRVIPAVLGFQGFCQVAAAEDESTSGFNIFVFLVPAGVIALLRWVFSLGPKMDEENAGYASTTLRGRDSEEKLQARIKAMEEQVKREELKTRMMMQGGPASQADLDELALLDDDLFSADLKRQLRAAQEK
ncbi:unnamed protein product [Effrenium voratum]|uniref:Uncharacterized protein n=1 Tax=Effrenium voratum TaxID=2562239 RepID=A0AA36J345_9DINO|nr:unnamed protein product [Effrenium voratum]CAJ1429811.1 unnamed protein product [Effrenium voratum]